MIGIIICMAAQKYITTKYDFISFSSLIPEGDVPGHLLPLLGQLCLACLVAAETGSPLVSDHPLVGACLATTNQMLTLSCKVTRAMLQGFQDRLKGMIMSFKMISLLSFVQLQWLSGKSI